MKIAIWETHTVKDEISSDPQTSELDQLLHSEPPELDELLRCQLFASELAYAILLPLLLRARLPILRFLTKILFLAPC